MINQYTSSYGSISSDIQNIIANKISLTDSYILMQTGQYEYTALVKNIVTKNTDKYVISRNSGINNYYTVSKSSSDFEYTVTNEYYVYSNVGYGKSLSLPVHSGVQSYSMIICCCILLLSIVFERVFFPCRKRKR